MAATIEASLQAGGGRPDEQAPHGMTLDDRREFVSNVLVTKRVVAKVGAAVGVERTKEDLVVSTNLASSTHQIQPGGPDTDTVTTSCAICIMEYQDGEDICCSHNEQCKHVFHRDCIMEWLLRHDECPCCRHNFLSLNDGEDNRPEQSSAVTPAYTSDESTTSSDGDPIAQFMRGLALFRTFARPSPPPRTESSPHVDEEQPFEFVDHELPVHEYFVNGAVHVSNVNPNRIVEDDDYSLDHWISEGEDDHGIVFSDQEEISNAISLTLLEDSLREMGTHRGEVCSSSDSLRAMQGSLRDVGGTTNGAVSNAEMKPGTSPSIAASRTTNENMVPASGSTNEVEIELAVAFRSRVRNKTAHPGQPDELSDDGSVYLESPPPGALSNERTRP
jgi:hypothetical protein